jgi:predicted MFS family arabinose efflux permease
MLASTLAAKRQDSLSVLLAFVVYSTLIAVPFLALCFYAKTTGVFLVGCAVAELFIFAGVAPLNSLIVAKAPAGYESFTQGITIFAIQLFGGFLGPVVIGGVADATGSLSMALQGTSLALLISGLLWWNAGRVADAPRRL